MVHFLVRLVRLYLRPSLSSSSLLRLVLVFFFRLLLRLYLLV